MIEKSPQIIDLASCMGEYSLAALDNDKLDVALRILREVGGEEPDSSLTRKEQIGKHVELITDRLKLLHSSLEAGDVALSEEERAFIENVSGIRDKLAEEVKKIDDVNIEIFKSSTVLGNNVDELYIKRALNYAGDLRRSKIIDPTDSPDASMIIDTPEGSVHKMSIENSSACYDTAFRLVTGKHYSSLLDLQDEKGLEEVKIEVERVGDLMFEGLKTYLREKHGEGSVLHLDENVKNHWLRNFRDELLRKLND